MPQKFAVALLWVDLESAGLPPAAVDEKLDYSAFPVLEVAALVTDFNLRPIVGYHEAIKLDLLGANMLRTNADVRAMHQESGLIADCIKSEVTLAQAEEEIIKAIMSETALSPGELMIAGSGVATFDFPLIKAKMPDLAKWLAYYPFDIGVLRRVSHILSGGADIVDHPQSYRAGIKRHRAWDDVEAHLEESRRWRPVFEALVKAGIKG